MLLDSSFSALTICNYTCTTRCKQAYFGVDDLRELFLMFLENLCKYRSKGCKNVSHENKDRYVGMVQCVSARYGKTNWWKILWNKEGSGPCNNPGQQGDGPCNNSGQHSLTLNTHHPNIWQHFAMPSYSVLVLRTPLFVHLLIIVQLQVHSNRRLFYTVIILLRIRPFQLFIFKYNSTKLHSH